MRQQIKFKFIAVTVGLLMGICLSQPISATSYVQGTVLSDRVFYQIGGGAAIMPPPSRKRPHELAIGVGWKANLMCGNFDFKTTIKNQLNGITEGFKDLYSNIIQSATGAVASLPAMIIQRANPQLYDILTNGLYQAKLDFDLLKTSCEEMSGRLADAWVEGAKLENFKDIVTLEFDAKKAKKRVEEDNGDKGITWIGGKKKGGKGQEPIKLLEDVISAGFNLSQERSVLEKSAIPETQCDGMMCTEWKTPADAATWVRDVLGDKTISTCENCGVPPKSVAGTGLAPKIEQESINVMTHFEQVLNSPTLTQEQLGSISSTTVSVTRGLIEALREDPDAPLLAARLSQEVAISRTLEKALVARRMLLAGMREPHVASNTQALEELNRDLTALDREINQVKMEMDLQKELNRNTTLAILNKRAADQQIALKGNSGDDAKFSDVTKEKNELDNSNEGQFKAKDKYIKLPIPGSTGGLSGIYGKYSPGSGGSTAGSYKQIKPIAGSSLDQATGLLRSFEGFSSKAYWDVNAYRTGYGSDTITKADGTVVKVTKDTIVTKEDAERDLIRRSQIFADRAKNQLSPSTWNALSPNVQAALTSYAYNYGSLTKDVIKAAQTSAQSGDMKALADAVRNRQKDNKGVNAKRRNQEADYILGKS
ncbi:integrating conjugative element protein [Pasteurella oralis]|uniref:integrating conjugative element protein n=1 Tax=Pasteurella oralis TaxID=1071947 RepID=UPI001FEB8EF6|nr:integrating conjugative element protein [Pasteurella oralis]